MPRAARMWSALFPEPRRFALCTGVSSRHANSGEDKHPHDRKDRDRDKSYLLRSRGRGGQADEQGTEPGGGASR